MFAVGDESRINGSELIEPSIAIPGEQNFLGKSQSILTDNQAERNRFMIENYDVIDILATGAFTYRLKVRYKVTGVAYQMKIQRKVKYGKH